LDELILQTLGGSARPSVQEQVRRWRDESPENESYYRQIAMVWAATEPEPLATGVPPVDPDVITAEADRRRGGAGVGPPRAVPGPETALADIAPIGRPRRRRLPTGLVRGAALAAGIAGLALSIRLLSPGADPGPAVSSYAAGDATPRTVLLDDGSFVRLAAGSEMETRMTDTARTVSLTGRAFFAVAPEAARPFSVRAGPAEARVVGTRFEVAEAGGTATAIVVEGQVAVANAFGLVEVPAGSLARVDRDSPPTTERPPDINALLDWPGGLLLFQGTPLVRVAEEVERAFDRSVTVEGKGLGALRISGSFENESFEEVIEALCDAVGAVCNLTDAGGVISPAEPPPPDR
jgi:transmembrane sensor